MTKSKTRSLDEDKQALQTKIQEHKSSTQDAQGNRTVRSLRKRLKRIQRKVRSTKAREAKAAAKNAPVAES
ncbi:MAG: hypothetical protein NPIRA05_18950 [Nitrospirales bacterium]|nr:MAG: hypothetical protein NPIRA05_18950 [Nitrospirales bacterium]